ncbi:hypothetical protein N7466_006000 [Penicillium verhagenii]|uniref:uncharacterized protein n=1 Tax=Penicillium verhagenii TaxID=1562060 RepID=UPI002545A008|nr:uncharacterized protein N7466_006000 [Penicillium verhagenii]KAJ5930507.1 hypothetical protein N7466_006000 [Penicillium verhagenii]
MKAFAVLAVLGASLGLALPLHDTSSAPGAQTALTDPRASFQSLQQALLTLLSTDSRSKSSSQLASTLVSEAEQDQQGRSPFQQYQSQSADRNRNRNRHEELGFIRSLEKELKIDIQPTPSLSDPFSAAEHHRSTSSYGIFLGRWLPFKSQNQNQNQNQNQRAHPLQCNPTERPKAARTVTYFKPLDVLDIMEDYGPVCIALAIFVLVPIAYFVLELLELTARYFIRERFPERGRHRCQLVGPERQLRAVDALQREKMVESEKRWWLARRTRSRVL